MQIKGYKSMKYFTTNTFISIGTETNKDLSNQMADEIDYVGKLSVYTYVWFIIFFTKIVYYFGNNNLSFKKWMYS